MGKKIFVSYKYNDYKVSNLPNNSLTTARHYVDEIQSLLGKDDHINKGENDGEDLSTLTDATIASKLGDKIYDSSITIVLISKGMKDNLPEKEQWIPWEISYSLREQSRAGRVSKTNAILAVVIPDIEASYDYFYTYNQQCTCHHYKTDDLFEILSSNMFNKKENNTRFCNGMVVYEGHFSYIHSVKWEDFKKDINKHIDIALQINSNKNDYNIKKNLS